MKSSRIKPGRKSKMLISKLIIDSEVSKNTITKLIVANTYFAISVLGIEKIDTKQNRNNSSNQRICIDVKFTIKIYTFVSEIL